MVFDHMDILLVDDNPINLKVLYDSLQDLECKIYVSQSGEDALNILNNLTPSIIITDIMMPGMDGYELVQEIRKNTKLKQIPIIFITALNDIENEVRALKLGAVDFITKPINPTLVKARVENHLKLKFYQDYLTLKAERKDEQFFSIFENAPDAILVINYKDDKIVMANKAAEKLFSKNSSELKEIAPLSFFKNSSINNNFLNLVNEEVVKKSVTGEISSFEWLYNSSTGKRYTCEVRLIRFPGDEPLLRASIIDITHRKKEEDALKSAHRYINNIMNSLPMVLVGLDSELKITHWNSRAKEYSGYDRSEAIGRNIIDMIPHIKLESDLIKQSIRENSINKRHKKSRITNKGTIFENITIFPISEYDESGVVLLIDDITDQVELQGMVIQSERMFSIGELASGVAHEITNPLAGIIQNGQSLINRLTTDLPSNNRVAKKYDLNLDSLRSYLEERNIIQMINSIRESGVKASHIIKNLNNFSKKDLGALTYNHLLPLIDQGLELAASDYNIELGYDFKDIEIVKKVEDDNISVLCEQAKLVQVFLNIFRFSAKNIGKDSVYPRIDITVSRSDDHLIISIKDNGELLTKEECQMLLEPYFRGKPTVREEWYSLSLSYFIVKEVHNGDFYIKSDTGNEIIITLPVPK